MSLPRFVQRLFANNGAGPKLRHDIIPWDEEKSLVALEAWRQAMIGTPMPMAGTTLPHGFMWADGSLALFDLWPELKAKYEKGGFSGLLLPYNCSDEDKKAYPLKWVPDSANPTGLFVPRLNGLFARYCGSSGAGKYNPAGLPEAAGGIYALDGYELLVANSVKTTDGFRVKTYNSGQASPGSSQNMAIAEIEFWASGCNSIYGSSHTVMPPSVDLPVALYLGRSTEI